MSVHKKGLVQMMVERIHITRFFHIMLTSLKDLPEVLKSVRARQDLVTRAA